MQENNNENKHCVYVHINTVNGKLYVGQTCNTHERWRCGGKNYFNCAKFYHAIKKYGWNKFIHVVVKDGLCQVEADKLEKKIIEEFDTIKAGYNLKEGGARGKLSEESLRKMGKGVRRAFEEHPEIKEKMRQKALGRKQSDDAKKKMMLNGNKSVLIEIDGEIGSIRYWAKKLGLSHSPLLWQKRRYGFDAMIKYIIDRLPTVA